MKTLTFLFLFLSISAVTVAQKSSYSYDEGEKIVASSEYKPNTTEVSKEFKRIRQFITMQKYDQVTEVPVKVGGNYIGPVVEKAVLIEDVEDGKIYGEGYIPFSMKHRDNFVLLFSYKIRITNGVVKYELHNFVVKEFVHLGISKGSMGAGQAMGYGMGTGKTKSGGADIRQYPLEEILQKKGVEEQFLAFLSNFRTSFRKAADGDL